MTSAKKTAVAIIRATADQLIKAVEQDEWSDGCVRFETKFLLHGIRTDKATMNGVPAACDAPLLRRQWMRVSA